MGNWRRATIVGTCDVADVPALREEIAQGAFGPLTDTGALLNLGNWAAERIHRTGNLAERDYSDRDVADHLDRLRQVAPSLDIEIHLGGDYEEDTCVASIVIKDGEALVAMPSVEKIGPIPDDQMCQAFMRNMTGRAPRRSW